MNVKLYFFIIVLIVFVSCNVKHKDKPINRYHLVTRHNITVKDIDTLASLSVGNGEFAFTTDITGLQTFPEVYERGVPLGTQSNWGWHSLPNIDSFTLQDVIKYYPVGDRKVPYVYRHSTKNTRAYKASEWLRENPHRLHLGLIGLELIKNNSTPLTVNDIKNPVQHLNMWTGEINSKFEFEGEPVYVSLFCHQELDMIAVSIHSPLIAQKKLKIKYTFPYSSTVQTCPGYDFANSDKHSTRIENQQNNEIILKRNLDSNDYYVKIGWGKSGEIKEKGKHEYLLVPSENDTAFEFHCLFSDKVYKDALPLYSDTRNNSTTTFKNFWMSGGAVDFSACTDPRAFELERRIILSQYLTKIQSSGTLPPQETGLTYNSWYGKFHLEMHWWHSWHFIAWNRPECMERQMEYYNNVYHKARQTAQMQGYKGVRWQKMTDPYGNESPSTVASFLIWQQPHVIYFAEMLYQHYKNEKTLLKYKDLVFATADFMASYARWDAATDRYVLGPALIPAQEIFAAETTINPAFELAYWYWGLHTAQLWRQRLGMGKSETYQHVLDNLSLIPVKDSLYLFTENSPESYSNDFYVNDHPIVLGAYGFVPKTPLIDEAIFNNTFDTVINIWNWDRTWGWDYPLTAMAAAKLHKPEMAIDMLLKDVQKNTYLKNGHNYQDKRLRLYLPGNGGILAAIAIMCNEAELDGENTGFPDNEQWHVKWENMGKLP